jgi:hypothetical protein
MKVDSTKLGIAAQHFPVAVPRDQGDLLDPKALLKLMTASICIKLL